MQKLIILTAILMTGCPSFESAPVENLACDEVKVQLIDCRKEVDEAWDYVEEMESYSYDIIESDTVLESWESQFYTASWKLSQCRDERNVFVNELDGLKNLYDSVISDLFVSCHQLCSLLGDCTCYEKHFGPWDTERNIPVQE